MNRWVRLARALVAVGIVAGGSVARGQTTQPAPQELPPPPGSFDKVEIGVFAGTHIWNEDNELGVNDNDTRTTTPEIGVAAGLRFAFNLIPRLAIEAEGMINPTKTKAGDANLLLIGVRGHLVFHILEGQFRPFILAGAGGLINPSEEQ